MKAESTSSEELDRLLGQRWLSGIWRVGREERPLDPKTTVRPHLWKWADIYDSLVQARSRIDIRSGGVERRVIRLVNPVLIHSRRWRLACRSVRFSFSLLTFNISR